VNRFYSIVFLSLWAPTSFASQPIEVYQLVSDHTYIQAPLEKEIYFYSQDANLSDVYVKDAQGNNLPYRVIDVPHKSQGIVRETPVPFFAIAPGTSPDMLRTLSSTRIEIKADQVQVEVNPEIKSLGEIKEKPEFYLLHLQAIDHLGKNEKNLKLKALILDWDKSQDQYQTWALSGSNDLRQWNFIRNGSLVRLEKDGYQLLQNKIELDLSPDSYAYLKLTCMEFCTDLRLTQIKLQEESHQNFVPPATTWDVEGEAVSANAIKLFERDNWRAAAVWEFTREEHANINSLAIEFGEQTYGDQLRLLGKKRRQDPWALVHQGIWFNLRLGADWQSTAALDLHGQWRYFRLELAAVTQLAPKLVLHSEPRLIQFVGNQMPPYKLVVQPGSPGSQVNVLNAMLRNYSPDWSNHEWQFLNPPKPEASRRIYWQSVLLWGCMLLAVLLLAIMALSLFRQMGRPATPEEKYKK
jgi:hypothetical protein